VLNAARWAFRIKKKAIQQFTKNDYDAARERFQAKLAREDQRYARPPLLVYQIGKVGSKTVTEALKQAKLDRHIYHFHHLEPDILERFEGQRRDRFANDGDHSIHYVWKCQHVRGLIERGLNGEKWKIVTLVRDPIARNLSDFFQNIRVEPEAEGEYKLKSLGYDFEVTVKNNNMEEFIKLFFERYEHDIHTFYFEREFKGVLGVDLYATDFPRSEGYKIYQEKEADILLIKLEHLNTCVAEAFKEFLGIENLTLVDENVGTQKGYAEMYRAFKDAIVFPESYLDRMYASQYARHFYSEAELAAFRKKWTQKK
jgi:hypothetical protein